MKNEREVKIHKTDVSANVLEDKNIHINNKKIKKNPKTAQKKKRQERKRKSKKRKKIAIADCGTHNYIQCVYKNNDDDDDDDVC